MVLLAPSTDAVCEMLYNMLFGEGGQQKKDNQGTAHKPEKLRNNLLAAWVGLVLLGLERRARQLGETRHHLHVLSHPSGHGDALGTGQALGTMHLVLQTNALSAKKPTFRTSTNLKVPNLCLEH
jgi:hypothetical protein